MRWALASCVAGLLAVAWIVPARAQVPFAEAAVSASATGTVAHAHAIESGGTRLVDGEVGFTGASFNSTGLGVLRNEVDREFAPARPDKTAFARGSAVEAGLGVDPETDNQLILAGKAEADSPPPKGPVTEEIGPADLAPLAWANLLRGRASAASVPDVCTVGTDLSNGSAYLADVQLLDAGGEEEEAAELAEPAEGLVQPVLALDADDPKRAVSQSRSRTLMVGQKAANGDVLGTDFGVMSEVRQTIAPVTFFKGTENEFTIELLGEWVLQAVATGKPGGAYVHYGPDAESPETPVARVIQAGEPTTIVKLQDVLGEEGFVVEIPDIAEVAIGEDPRQIGGNAESAAVAAEDGTAAAAAVDVVRVKALPGVDFELADVRVGHMEVQAKVPSGGVSCPLPVSKTPDADHVNLGDTFTMSIKIDNPYDCRLTDVRLEDVVSTEGDARFRIESTEPATDFTGGSDLASGNITWADLGDIGPHDSRTVSAVFRASGGAGKIIDTATATGELAGCAEGAAVGGVDVSAVGAELTGQATGVEVPVVKTEVASAIAEQTAPKELPRTGWPIGLLVMIALAAVTVGTAGVVIARYMR